ncbi:hypothetical protein Ct61P_10446 [Colletotrichum tofieldiae]|nr:hypothetical protein Ct61P_10446 [Colletotrichum tofieldiae]
MCPSINVHIEPGADRSIPEKQKLADLRRESANTGESSREILYTCMEVARNAILDGGKVDQSIKDDVLSIKITGSSHRALQLVDLTSLIGYDKTGGDIVGKVDEVVRSYMEMKQSTILDAVPGNNNIDNAHILTNCDKYDPKAITPLVSSQSLIL